MKRIAVLLLAVWASVFFMTAAADDTTESEIIRQGAKGEAVVRIQMRLFDLGYYTYKPTGSYQTVTKSAVSAYQIESGLMSDGSIGPESLRALFSRGAVRAPFHAAVPLTYTAQSGTFAYGVAAEWDEIKPLLVPEQEYTITNATTGETCALIFQGGENHADFSIPIRWNTPDPTLVKTLSGWLGDANSFYKCAVLLTVNNRPIAASIQWNGIDAVCLYVTGSTSHVFGLPDADHDAMIAKITNR